MTEPLILVPLDGSDLSEAAIPFARAIAQATDARLLLLAVWEGPEEGLASSLPAVAEDLVTRGEQHYRDYLAGVAGKLSREDVEVETDVRIGHVVEEILHVLEEREARMLAMATHGRSGIGRWWYGSVASKLIRQAPVPTMVVGPKVLEGPAPAGAPGRILVPLDGSPLAESALQPGRELAEKVGAELVLAQVLRWAVQGFALGIHDVADVGRIDRELTAAAEQYLARAKERLGTDRPVATMVLHGFPADALIDLIEVERIDLVVMASHARGGLARATLGSVADRMLHGGAPVVLIRPEIAAGVVRVPRARSCHACGRAVSYIEVEADDRCLRCGQHLHACANCVYFDGIACLLQRSEVHDAYPGRDCPEFQFRETLAATTKAGKPQREGREPT